MEIGLRRLCENLLGYSLAETGSTLYEHQHLPFTKDKQLVCFPALAWDAVSFLFPDRDIQRLSPHPAKTYVLLSLLPGVTIPHCLPWEVQKVGHHANHSRRFYSEVPRCTPPLRRGTAERAPRCSMSFGVWCPSGMPQMHRFLWVGHPALGGHISATWDPLTFICQDNRSVAGIGTTQRGVNRRLRDPSNVCYAGRGLP